MQLPVTMPLVCFSAIWLVILSMQVIRARWAAKVSHGDGGDRRLMRAIRGHANFIEYAPIFIILIAVLELQGGHMVVLAVFAAIFVIGRLMHGYAFSFTDTSRIGRQGGMVLSHTATISAALYGLFIYLV